MHDLFALFPLTTFIDDLESRKAPEIYLGADVAKVQTAGGHEVWSTSSETYVQNAVKMVENLLIEDGKDMQLRSPSKAKNLFPSNYRPEVDITAELDSDLIPRYLQLIGMLRCYAGSFIIIAVSGKPKSWSFGCPVSHLCLFAGTPEHGAHCI